MREISPQRQRKNLATTPPSCLSRGEEGRRVKEGGETSLNLTNRQQIGHLRLSPERGLIGQSGPPDPLQEPPLPCPPHALLLTSLGGVAEIVVGGAGSRIVPELPAAQTEGPADRRFF